MNKVSKEEEATIIVEYIERIKKKIKVDVNLDLTPKEQEKLVASFNELYKEYPFLKKARDKLFNEV